MPDATTPATTPAATPTTTPALTDGVDVVPHRRRRRWPWVALLVLLLVVGGYAAAVAATADRVPRGTTVLGERLGGLARAAAEERLAALAERVEAVPVAVTAGGADGEVAPAAAGLSLDVEATLDRVAGGGWDPRPLWRHVAGGGEVAPATAVDEAALQAEVAALAERVDAEPVDAAVGFASGAPEPRQPQQGRELQREEAASVLAEEWPREPGAAPLELPAETTEPDVDAADLEAALAGPAAAAVAGPVTFVVADREVALAPAAFAPALSLQPQDGELAWVLDAPALRGALVAADAAVEAPAESARIELQDGRPAVVPAVQGRALDLDALRDPVVAGLAAPDRRAVLPTAVTEPELTTEEAQALGVSTPVSSFSTNLTADAGRSENIAIAARTMDGTLVLPGETFSLNEVLGERTPEKGYNEAPVIMGGRLVKGYGGGVSQVATTTWNAVFFAGLDEVEHKPHSFYISRYPEGREATISWGSVDLKWRNDSPYGVLVQSYVSGGQVTVVLWSTPRYEVEAVKGPRRDVVQPERVYDPSPGCVAQSPSPGFRVTVTRVLRQGGVEVGREDFTHRYSPEDEVICSAPPAG